MKSIILIVMMLAAGMGHAQRFTETITRELAFEKKSADNAIIVANISGHVNVTGYDGDKVVLEVTKTVTAKTDARLAEGKEDIQLGVIDMADTLIFYVKTKCNDFNRDRKHGNNTDRGKNNWGYHWQGDRQCDANYYFKMDFTLKVPVSAHVVISTINDGNIAISNVKGIVHASNINGSVKVTNLSRETQLSTINGDVDFDYDTNPNGACRFYTLNGNINANFRKDLAANLSFKTFNGAFYSDIDRIQMLSARLEKTEKGQGVKYKVNGNQYKVGAGGALLDFETFNGNVYLKEKTN